MKITKKTLLTAGSYAAVAALAVGGTLANFSYDDEQALNVVTVGEAVDIAINEYQRNEDGTALEDFEQGKKLYPIVESAQGEKDNFGMPTDENYGDKIVTVENTGDSDAFIRVFVAKPLALADLAGDGSANTSDDALHSNLGNRVDLEGDYDKAYGDAWATNWGWAYNVEVFEAEIDGEMYEVATYYLKEALAIGAESTAVMAGVYLDSKVDYDDGVYTMGDYVLDYDFSNGVNIPVYAEAVAASDGMTYTDAFADRPAAEIFETWADSVELPVSVATADELTAALANGGTVLLTEDLDLGDTQISIPAGVEATLILGGNDITAEIAETSTYGMFNVAAGATLNIEGDGNVALTSSLSKGVSTCIFQNDGTLNIYGGNYTVDGSYTVDGIYAVISVVDTCVSGSDAVTNIYGGTYSLTGEKAVNIFRNWPINNATATLNIYDGTFNANPDKTTTYIWNKNDTNLGAALSYVNIEGGTYNGNIVVEVDGYESSVTIADGIDLDVVAGSITGFVPEN